MQVLFPVSARERPNKSWCKSWVQYMSSTIPTILHCPTSMCAIKVAVYWWFWLLLTRFKDPLKDFSRFARNLSKSSVVSCSLWGSQSPWTNQSSQHTDPAVSELLINSETLLPILGAKILTGSPVKFVFSDIITKSLGPTKHSAHKFY